MKPLLPVLFLAALPATAQVVTIMDENATNWAYLHPTDGTDPATSGGDADFQSTWFHQDLAPYFGGTYNGPSFTTGATAPFQYGTVDGLMSAPGLTTLATPASGSRYTSYFVRMVDGGANGYHSLEIEALADDGLFVYLNGVLVANDGTTGSDTYVTGSAGSETSYSGLTLIGTPTLNPGPNLLAVSNHNTSATSTDLGFAIRLRGIDASIPVQTTLVADNSGGSATAADYTPALSGSVTFAIGETSQPLNLTIAPDSLAEGTETLTIVPRTDTITGTSGARDTYFLGSPGNASVTLNDRSSQGWWHTHFGTATLTATDWEIDHDGDMLDALLEYGLGGDPNVNDLSIAPELVETPTTVELHYTKDNSLADIQYTVKATSDLQTFMAADVTDVLDGPANPSGPEDRKASIPIAGPFGGLRLEITMP